MLGVWTEYFLEVHCISFDPSCWAPAVAIWGLDTKMTSRPAVPNQVVDTSFWKAFLDPPPKLLFKDKFSLCWGSGLSISWRGPNSGREPFRRSILAFWHPSGPPLKFPFGINGKRPFWANSWPGALLELDFGTLAAVRAPIKISFWDQWETAILGQILARNPFGAWCCKFDSHPHHYLKRGPILERGQEPFWSSILAFWQPSGPPLKFPFGINGKRPFWTKSWPGPLLELDVSILTPFHVAI